MLDNPRIYKGHIEYFGQFDASKDKPTHIGFTIPTRRSVTDTNQQNEHYQAVNIYQDFIF